MMQPDRASSGSPCSRAPRRSTRRCSRRPTAVDVDLSSLRFAVTGAAVVPVALVERMQSELGFDLVLTAFGMTECVVGTMCRRGDPADAGRRHLRPRRPRARAAHREAGCERPLPAGEEGEVLFRGDTVMLGYLDDPEATAEADRRRRLAAHRRRRHGSTRTAT